MESTLTGKPRVRGLDSIRFICALWVFFGHASMPPLPIPFADGSTAHLILRGLYGNIWSGPAAVIVFFVISGFCIHYPFAGTRQTPNLKEFYTRRFCRILLPITVATPLSSLVGIDLALLHDSVLWTLLAESIYYLLYPAFRRVQLYLGSWRGIVIVSFVAALVLVAVSPADENYATYGPGWNWLMGLPCWLMGCMVAEVVSTAAQRDVSARAIWIWRAAVLGAVILCSGLRFHSPISYAWTLNFFAILVAFWLPYEIAFRRRVAPPRILEWAGLWSYSLYLLHPFASTFLRRFYPSISDTMLGWFLLLLFVLLVAYVFYLLVEFPSHALAKWLGRKFRPEPVKAAAMASTAPTV